MRFLLTFLAIALGLVGCVMLVGLPIAAHRFFPGDEWLGVVGLVPLIVAVACSVWLWQRQYAQATYAFTVGAAVFAVPGQTCARR